MTSYPPKYTLPPTHEPTYALTHPLIKPCLETGSEGTLFEAHIPTHGLLSKG